MSDFTDQQFILQVPKINEKELKARKYLDLKGYVTAKSDDYEQIEINLVQLLADLLRSRQE